MRTKRVLCGVFFALTISSAIIPAYAEERQEPVFVGGSDPASIAAELLSDGDAYVLSYGTDMAAKRRVQDTVQAYIDAVSSTSATPIVRGSIIQNGTADECLKLALVQINNEFSNAELDGLSAKAGNTAGSISSYLCGRLSYDNSAAAEHLSQSSKQVTAKGSLQSGKAVCQGYANAFALLADNAGIKSVKVRGYDSNGIFHVVNVVEGGFVCDITYTDSHGGTEYFMIPLQVYCKQTGFKPIVDFETAFELKYGIYEIELP